LVVEDNTRLQEETLRMKELLETRKLVERAKGILQLRYKLSEQQAYERMRDESRRMRKPVRSVAEAVLLVESLINDTPDEVVGE
jgi:AmiR/NasT family two-component response regulator